MTASRFPNPRSAMLLVVLGLNATQARAGVVISPDGREWAGEVKLEAPASVVITEGGAQQKLALADIASIDFTDTTTITTPAADGVPAPWRSADIGAVTRPGSARFDGGVFDLSATGWGVWSPSDSCHFVHRELAGDGQVIARVLPFVKDARQSAGVMMRASLAPDASFMALSIIHRREMRINIRPRKEIDQPKSAGPVDQEQPRWLRLARAGNRMSVYRSDDGVGWTLVGEQEVDVGATALVGLFTASSTNDTPAHAKFDRVRVIAGDPATTPLPASPLPPRGIVLIDGTSSPAMLQSLTADTATFVGADGKPNSVPAAQAAFAVFDPSFVDLHALVTANGPGVLLKNGDYLGGDITGVNGTIVTVNSVLFGVKQIELAKEVSAIVLRAPSTWTNNYHVRTKDGAVRAATTIRIDADQVEVGATRIPVSEIVHVIRVP